MNKQYATSSWHTHGARNIKVSHIQSVPLNKSTYYNVHPRNKQISVAIFSLSIKGKYFKDTVRLF